jgi:hypothetical protein
MEAPRREALRFLPNRTMVIEDYLDPTAPPRIQNLRWQVEGDRLVVQQVQDAKWRDLLSGSGGLSAPPPVHFFIHSVTDTELSLRKGNTVLELTRISPDPALGR